ncbi:MAG: GerMN domain-containing protein [Candidatus Acidiferrales bacterium]
MTRNLKITIAILAVAVIIGLLSLRGLSKRIERLQENPSSEEQARRELLAPKVSTPTDVLSRAKIYWAAAADSTAPTEVELALSADPVKRARQVIDTLVSEAPSPEQRTLPEDTTLLGFYLLPDGTAVADFSDSLSSETPSGILSERLAVDSIVQTLKSNLPAAHRLKILIHGQEVDTLAGHVDLTGFFDLNPPAAAPAVAEPIAAPASPVPALPKAPASPDGHLSR